MTQTTESQQLKVFKYEKPAGEIEMGKVTLRLLSKATCCLSPCRS